MTVDPGNAAAAAAWDGPAGDVWVARADGFDAGVARYTPAFLAAARIAPEAHVLDVGCGAGETTIAAARAATAGSATGVDLSGGLLEVARRRAASLGNVTFVQADAQVADLGAARFDLVISRTGVMFFADPVAAFTNLAGALRPGGRLVLLTWQPLSENEWLDTFLRIGAAGRPFTPPPSDRPSPLGLSEPVRINRVLTAAGFAPPRLDGLHEPMFFGADVDAAERMVSGIIEGALAEMDETTRAAATHELRASLQAHLGPDGVTFRSGMWLITTERPD